MAESDIVPDPDGAASLRSLVRRHRAYLELEPVFQEVDGRPTRHGTDLTLRGVHLRSSASRTPCPRCLAVRSDLERIASSILTAEADAHHLELEPFDQARSLSSRFGRDEISVTLRFRAESGEAASVAGDRLLTRLRMKLESLGVFTGGWQPSDL